jgi:hypothetical protein
MQVGLIVHGLGNQVQEGLPQPRQVRDIRLRAPGFMRVRDRVIDGSVTDLLTWVLDRKCEFIAIHEQSKDHIMHHI